MRGLLFCCTLVLVLAVLCAAVGAQTGLAQSHWPKYGGNLGNTGLSAYAGPATPVVKGKINVKQPITCSPAITPGGDIVLSVGDRLLVLGADGKLKAQYLTAAMGGSSPAVAADGTIYVGGTVSKRLLAIPPGPPKQGGTAEEPSLSFAWKFETERPISSSPTIGPDGTVYFGCDDGCLYAIAPNGTGRWRYFVGAQVRCCPLLAADGTMYVMDSEAGAVLHALGPDGKRKWRTELGWGADWSPALRPDGSIVACASIGQVIACGPDGRQLWVFEPPDDGALPTTGPAIGAQGEVYYDTDQDSLAAMTADGKPAWNCKLDEGPIAGNPAIDSGGTIHAGTKDGILCAVGADGKLKWQHNLGVAVTSPVVIGGEELLYVGCADGSLYAIGQ